MKCLQSTGTLAGGVGLITAQSGSHCSRQCQVVLLLLLLAEGVMLLAVVAAAVMAAAAATKQQEQRVVAIVCNERGLD
jgi:hypothetical protein